MSSILFLLGFVCFLYAFAIQADEGPQRMPYYKIFLCSAITAVSIFQASAKEVTNCPNHLPEISIEQVALVQEEYQEREFKKLSCSRINDFNLLDNEMRIPVWGMLQKAKKEGLQVELYETWRSPCRQNKLFQQGITPRQDSLHMVGQAVDIVFLHNGQPSWSPKHNWNKLGQIGRDAGLMWGGDFPSKNDLVHFELPGKNGYFQQPR